MNKQPELLTAAAGRGSTHIPATSPYYDRLRSLSMQLDFAPIGSPERDYLNRQIEELTDRAEKRMLTDLTIKGL